MSKKQIALVLASGFVFFTILSIRDIAHLIGDES